MESNAFFVSYVLLWLLAIATATAVYALAWQYGHALLNTRSGREEQGLKSGEQTPSDVLEDVAGRTVSIGPGTLRPQVFTFTTLNCPPCKKALQGLDAAARSITDSVDLFLICRGSKAEVIEFARGLPPSVFIVADPHWELGRAFRVGGTPFAFSADRHGQIRARTIPGGQESFEGLIAYALHAEKAARAQLVALLARTETSPAETA